MLSTGKITNRVNFYTTANSTTPKLELCKVIPLGFPYCYIDTVTDTSTTVKKVAIGSATITKTF